MNAEKNVLIQQSDGSIHDVIVKGMKFSKIYKCPFILYTENNQNMVAPLVENDDGSYEYNPTTAVGQISVMSIEFFNPLIKQMNVDKLPDILYCSSLETKNHIKSTIVCIYMDEIGTLYYDKYGKQIMDKPYYNYLTNSINYQIYKKNIINKDRNIYIDENSNYYLDIQGKYMISPEKYQILKNDSSLKIIERNIKLIKDYSLNDKVIYNDSETGKDYWDKTKKYEISKTDSEILANDPNVNLVIKEIDDDQMILDTYFDDDGNHYYDDYGTLKIDKSTYSSYIMNKNIFVSEQPLEEKIELPIYTYNDKKYRDASCTQEISDNEYFYLKVCPKYVINEKPKEKKKYVATNNVNIYIDEYNNCYWNKECSRLISDTQLNILFNSPYYNINQVFIEFEKDNFKRI